MLDVVGGALDDWGAGELTEGAGWLNESLTMGEPLVGGRLAGRGVPLAGGGLTVPLGGGGGRDPVGVPESGGGGAPVSCGGPW